MWVSGEFWRRECRQLPDQLMFIKMMFTSLSVSNILEGCRWGGRGDDGGSWGSLGGWRGGSGGGRFRAVPPHVFLQGALVAGSVVPLVVLAVEEAVEASCRIVAGDGGVELATVASVVGGTRVPSLATDAAVKIGGTAGALVGVV